MEFCNTCENMLYLRVNDESQLEKHCKFCNESILESQRAVTISKTLISEDNVLFEFHQNPYLKYDPTIPRINNVPCRNPKCREEHSPPKLLYVKYNATQMLYFYSCEYCGETWKSDQMAPSASKSEN